MRLMDIAIRNLLRRKAKAAFILSGLVIGVATAVAVISYIDAMTADINHKLEQYGANILILPRSDNLALTYGGMALGGIAFDTHEIRQTDLDRIHAIHNAPNIAAVGPMVLGGVTVKARRVLLAGVDFEAALILKPWWRIRGRLPTDDGLLAGAEAARLLDLEIGRLTDIDGQKMQVEGILAPTGSQDDHLLFARLSKAQALLDKMDRVTLVEVAALCTACPIGDMVAQIAAVLPSAKVQAIQQVVQGRMQTLAQFRRFSYGISAVVVLIAGLVVLVTMMGSVRERTEEIGIFRAVGFRRQHVMRIVFIEAGLVSTAAGIAGYAAGWAAAWVGARLMGGTGQIPFSPSLAATAVGLAVAVGLAAGAYPALMAARLDPNQALRSL